MNAEDQAMRHPTSVCAQAKWWDITFYIARARCWLFGHGPIDSIRSFYEDPNSKEAREMVVLWHQAFGGPFLCCRCGKPMGMQ